VSQQFGSLDSGHREEVHIVKIALISPISGLEKWSAMGTLHLVLAQIDDQKYIDFYKSRRERGETLILDNGAYEGTMVDDRRLADMTAVYNPQVVVLPDLPFQSPRLNLQRANDYYQKHAESHRKYMFVPHTDMTDLGEWLSEVNLALSAFKQPWIGLSRLLLVKPKLHFVDLTRLRSCLAMLIRHLFGPLTYIHALGQYGDNPLEEIKWLRRAGIDSIDTSGPIWRGWCGYVYGDRWPDIPIDFHAHPQTTRYPSDIKANLQSIGFLDDRLWVREEQK
jgi:hypothetical protein